MVIPRNILLAVGVIAAVLLGGQSALAASYTLSGPIVITDAAGNSITLSGVGAGGDAGTQNLLDGVMGTDIFVFDVEVTAGDFEQISASVVFANLTGIGYYSDGETAPTGGTNLGASGEFDYVTPLWVVDGDPANLTGAGNRLFLSFNGFLGSGDGQFMVQSFGVGIEDGGGPLDPNASLVPIPPIPEPGTLTLSGLGLVALAAAGRRRRS